MCSENQCYLVVPKVIVTIQIQKDSYVRVDGMRKKLHDEMFSFCLVHMQCSLLRRLAL